MKLLKQVLGICDTGKPLDEGCWSVNGSEVTIGMNRAKEILKPGGAVRLEGKGLPFRILVFQGLDGRFYALKNKCTHMGGRRLDPTVDKGTVKCCSVMGSVFSYNGEVLAGPARKPLVSFPVKTDTGRIIVTLET